MHTSTLKHFTLSHLLYDYTHTCTLTSTLWCIPHTHSMTHTTHTPTVWYTPHTANVKVAAAAGTFEKMPKFLCVFFKSESASITFYFFQVWKCLYYINVTLKSTKAKESLCDHDIRFALMLQHGWLSNKYVTNLVVKLTSKDFPYKCSVQGKAKMKPFD